MQGPTARWRGRGTSQRENGQDERGQSAQQVRPASAPWPTSASTRLDDDPDDAPIIITGRKATRSHRLTDAEKEANRLVSR
ncbi:hypothetical protein ABZZ80_09800 [Streptomyces sp. NPDC006356]